MSASAIMRQCTSRESLNSFAFIDLMCRPLYDHAMLGKDIADGRIAEDLLNEC
jgi:hypothetical protein